MHSMRLWPTVAPVIRSVVGGRSELLQSVKNYGNPPVSQTHQPHSVLCWSSQQQQLDSSCLSLSTALQSKLKLSSTLKLPFTTSCKLTQHFQHNENEHAHEILCSLPAYFNTTMPKKNVEKELPPLLDLLQCPPPLSSVDWVSVPPQGVAGSFIALSRQCLTLPMNLNSLDHSNLINALISSIPSLNDNQLKDVVAALTLWPPVSNNIKSNFYTFWNSLDVECVKRMNKWDLSLSFVVADLWYALKLSRAGSYTRVMLAELGHQIDEMTPQNIVQYCFYVNLNREWPYVSHTRLEKKIAQVMDRLTIEELGVIAMGFFKSRADIATDELTDALFERLISDGLESTSSITLGCIFKALRNTQHAPRADKIYQILDIVLPLLPNLSLLAQLQVALLGTSLLIFHSKVIEQIAVNFASSPSSLRLKDMERMVFVLMLYNFVPPGKQNILQIFADELRKEERLSEINHYPKSFFSCVNYMATMGYLPLDLVTTALSPPLIKALEKGENYGDVKREMLELDFLLDIEGPACYTGNRLDGAKKCKILQHYWAQYRLPAEVSRQKARSRLTHNESLILDIEAKLVALLGGQDRVFTVFVLPHVPIPDIVFCTDEFGSSLPLPQSYLDMPAPCIRYPPATAPDTGQALRWAVVIAGGRNSYVRGSTRLRGQMQMKIRQLQSVGYTPVVIPYAEYGHKTVARKLSVLDTALVHAGVLSSDPHRHVAAYLQLNVQEDERGRTSRRERRGNEFA